MTRFLRSPAVLARIVAEVACLGILALLSHYHLWPQDLLPVLWAAMERVR